MDEGINFTKRRSHSSLGRSGVLLNIIGLDLFLPAVENFSFIMHRKLFQYWKTTCKYGTGTAPSSSKLLCDRTVGSPVRVRSETTSLFEYSYIDHTYGHTSIYRRIAEKKYEHSSCLSADSKGRADGVDVVFTVATQSRISRQFFL